jgi:hypothetical protein
MIGVVLSVSVVLKAWLSPVIAGLSGMAMYGR